MYFHAEVNVYSAKANAWKRNKRYFPHFLNSDTQRRGFFFFFFFFFGNALHWLVPRIPESNVFEGIVAFDIAAEEYREVSATGLRKGLEFQRLFGIFGRVTLCGL